MRVFRAGLSIVRNRGHKVGRLFIAVVSVLLVAMACTSKDSSVEVGDRIGSDVGIGGGSGVTAPPSTSSVSNPDQLPSTLPIEGKHACDIIDEDVAATVDLVDPRRERAHNKWGSICSLTTSDVYLLVLLTDGPSQGLAELSTEGGQVESRTVGPFAARQEANGPVCSFDVAVAPGRALSVRYETSRQGEDPCAGAESLATTGLVNLANGTSPNGSR